MPTAPLTLETIGSTLLELVAERLQITGTVISRTVLDCCDEADCNDTDEQFVIELRRPDVDSVTLTIWEEPGHNPDGEFTPADLVERIAAVLAGWQPNYPAEQVDELDAFVQAGRNGVSALHLPGIIMTEMLIFDSLVERTAPTVTLCDGS
jgi:hypothetical protein